MPLIRNYDPENHAPATPADRRKLQADRVETVVVQDVPSWLIIAVTAVLFWDSPLRWPGQIRAGWR